jgi:hypothetical protein
MGFERTVRPKSAPAPARALRPSRPFSSSVPEPPRQAPGFEAQERAAAFGHSLSRLPAPQGAGPVQRVVRPGRGANAGKFYSTEAQEWFNDAEKAEKADRAAASERLERAEVAKEKRAQKKRERLSGDVEVQDAEWPLDVMTQKAHNRPRDPKYATHSTTAVGIPISSTGPSAFGQPVISQQRNEQATVDELKTAFDEADLPDAHVIHHLESGQHADPFAVYQAFAGNFEETGELADAILMGVSKGRCADCDDAVSDFPVVMDPDYTLGHSTKKWKHGRRMNVEDEAMEEEDGDGNGS